MRTNISAEIPDKDLDPELCKLVGSCMMHGPCGEYNKNALCNINDRCSKFFPKKFVPNTVVDDKGHATYRRRQDGRTIKRKKIAHKFCA